MAHTTATARENHPTKVPAVTLGFWVIKILATTLGETAGDTLSMTFNLGYLISTGVFGALLVALVAAQIRARRFNQWLYWATIVASTTAGTTLADFADRSLGIGYTGSASLLLLCVLASLLAWYRSEGTIAVGSIDRPRVEMFYWVTITFSQTLGTALGDWIADTSGLGYLGGAAVFAVLLLVTYLLHRRRAVSEALLFWAAFILTRPLGATVGDFLDKPFAHGGLALSRPLASLVLLALIVAGLLVISQRPAQRAH